jgi:hypothetical protein
MHGRGENECNISVGKAEGKGPVIIYSCIWEDNIRIVLNELVWGGVDWMHLAHRDQWWAVVNTV